MGQTPVACTEPMSHGTLGEKDQDQNMRAKTLSRNALNKRMQMSQEALVHVINKANTTEHHTIHTDTSSLPALAQGYVRVRTRLVGLTANNLTYARHAPVGNWWNAFRVPSFLPPPYNDTTKYGIVGVWGYGEIVASRVSGLETGAVLYGYWPSSSLPVDLHLEAAAEPRGHYIDTTPHRQTNWAFYHRYILVPAVEDLTSPTLAAETIFKPVFECAYTLNAYVLGPRALHPAPDNYKSTSSSSASPSWSLREEDLSKAVFISLAASGKTARAFNDAVLNDRRSSLPGPQAFIAVTSNPATFSLPPNKHHDSNNNNNTTHHIETLVLSYAAALSQEEDNLTSFLASLPSQPISKIVIADFGARGNCTEALVARLRSYFDDDNNSTEERISVVGIGSEPTPATISTTTTAENLSNLAAAAAAGNTTSSMSPPQQVFIMNTCVVREALIEEMGASAYFDNLNKAWEGFIARGGCRDVSVEVGRGVKELEVGWRRLCAGEAASVGGLAYLL